MTTTLRMPDDVATYAREQAGQRGESLNDFIVSAVRQSLAEQKAAAWREGFEAQASDFESMDVSFAFAAQSEVALAN